MSIELDYVGGSKWMETLRKNLEKLKSAIEKIESEIDELKALQNAKETEKKTK